MISRQGLHRIHRQQSHFKFTLPGKHTALLNIQGLQELEDQLALTSSPSTSTALNAALLAATPQGPGGTYSYASELRLLENKLEVRSASNNARPRQSQMSAGQAEPRGLPGGEGN